MATGALTFCWWERKMIQALWKNIWKFSIKLTTFTPIISSNSIPGYLPERNKYVYQEKNTFLHNYLYSSFNHNHQKLETTQMPFSWWVDKQIVVHLYTEILPSDTMKQLLNRATTWLNLKGFKLSDRSQCQKVTY